MATPKKWYPPTDAQLLKKITIAEDKAILTAYAKAGDPLAKELLKKLEDTTEEKPATWNSIPSPNSSSHGKAPGNIILKGKTMTKVIVRIRPAEDTDHERAIYIEEPTRDELLNAIADMGDVNVNYFFQYENGQVSRRSSASSTSTVFERSVG